MTLEAEIGRQLDNRWEVFLRPGMGLWGKDVEGGYDWKVECGVRWMFASPLIY